MKKTYRMKSTNADVTVKVQGINSKSETQLKVRIVTDDGKKCASLVYLEESGLLSDSYYPCDNVYEILSDYESKRFKQIDELEKILKSYVEEFRTDEWITPDLEYCCWFSKREYRFYSTRTLNWYKCKFNKWTFSGGTLLRNYTLEIVTKDKNGNEKFKKIKDLVVPNLSFMMWGLYESFEAFLPKDSYSSSKKKAA